MQGWCSLSHTRPGCERREAPSATYKGFEGARSSRARVGLPEVGGHASGAVLPFRKAPWSVLGIPGRKRITRSGQLSMRQIRCWVTRSRDAHSHMESCQANIPGLNVRIINTFLEGWCRSDVRDGGGFPSTLENHVVEVARLTSKNYGRNVTVEMLRRISTKEPQTCFAAEGIGVATAQNL